MLGRDFANTTSAIGARTLQQAAIPNNQPNWGVMLAQGLNAWNEKKANEEKEARLGAYGEALKEMHPEDAARIDAMGALEAGAYYDALDAEQREQQNKLAILKQQFNDSMAKMAQQNKYNVGLAQLKENIANAAAQAERDRQLAYIDQEVAAGRMTPQEAAQRRHILNLGDIASGRGGDGDVSINGIKLTGNKKYDDVIMKDAAERELKYRDAVEELNTFKNTANTIRNLLPKANLDTLIERKTPTFWLDKDQQIARQYIQNIMGNLRLDEMQYMKGAISDKEQAFLSDVVSGDISKYTPSQIEGTLQSIERKMSNEINRYAPPIKKVQGNITYSGKKLNSGKDWSQVSNEDLMRGL